MQTRYASLAQLLGVFLVSALVSLNAAHAAKPSTASKSKTTQTTKAIAKPTKAKAKPASRQSVAAKPVARSTKRKTAVAAVAPTSKRVSTASSRAVVRSSAVQRTSYGTHLGLHKTSDSLELRSNAALVMDAQTGEILFEKNAHTVLPIASITKLMTALVVIDAQLPLNELITIDTADLDTEKGTHSRLAFGTVLTRREALLLALMSSENRAASALGRHYPGGLAAFVTAMNARARLIGMTETEYVDANGLSPRNRSSAHDLARLVRVAYDYPLIRELSTSQDYTIDVNGRQQEFRNTNGLVRSANWQIGLQKTGYISEAGRCLVMHATIEQRAVVMVLLDSWGKYSRIGDANRIRDWVEAQPVMHRTAGEAWSTRPVQPAG